MAEWTREDIDEYFAGDHEEAREHMEYERGQGDNFWDVIDTQLTELRTAASADDVLRILSQERNPYGPGSSSADGFFAGSGGDGSVLESLEAAGWSVTWFDAHYHWHAKAPNGDKIRYVEGDIYRA